MDKQVAVFHLALIKIHRARRRAADYLSIAIEFSIMAWANVFFCRIVPIDPAAQVCADIRKHNCLALALAVDEYTIAIGGFFPAINFGAGETEEEGG